MTSQTVALVGNLKFYCYYMSIKWMWTKHKTKHHTSKQNIKTKTNKQQQKVSWLIYCCYYFCSSNPHIKWVDCFTAVIIFDVCLQILFRKQGICVPFPLNFMWFLVGATEKSLFTMTAFVWFLPWKIRMCVFKVPFWVNTFWQMTHLNGFSPLWIIRPSTWTTTSICTHIYIYMCFWKTNTKTDEHCDFLILTKRFKFLMFDLVLNKKHHSTTHAKTLWFRLTSDSNTFISVSNCWTLICNSPLFFFTIWRASVWIALATLNWCVNLVICAVTDKQKGVLWFRPILKGFTLPHTFGIMCSLRLWFLSSRSSFFMWWFSWTTFFSCLPCSFRFTDTTNCNGCKFLKWSRLPWLFWMTWRIHSQPLLQTDTWTCRRFVSFRHTHFLQ